MVMNNSIGSIRLVKLCLETWAFVKMKSLFGVTFHSFSANKKWNQIEKKNRLNKHFSS